MTDERMISKCNKIMFLVCVGGYSGAENMTLLIADELVHRGYEVAYCSPGGEIDECIRKHHRGIRRMRLDGFRLSRIKSAIREYQPDMVYAVDFKVSMLAGMLNTRYIVHLHNNPAWIRRKSLFTHVLLYSLNRSAANICVSDSIMEEFVFAGKVQKECKTLWNVVDADKVLALARDEIRGNYDIGFLGRLTEQKDPARFISLVKLLKGRLGYHPRTVMVGADGGLWDECRQKTAEYGLDIDYVGFRENPYPYMAGCRIILMPSKWEGFGLTAVESMILGVPVLASPVGGLPTVIGIRENLCWNDGQFVERAADLLTDETKYREVSQQVTRQASLFTDVGKYVDEIEDMLGERHYAGK